MDEIVLRSRFAQEASKQVDGPGRWDQSAVKGSGGWEFCGVTRCRSSVPHNHPTANPDVASLSCHVAFLFSSRIKLHQDNDLKRGYSAESSTN